MLRTAPTRSAAPGPRAFSAEAACRTMRATRMTGRRPRRLRSLAVLAVAAVGATLAVAVATGAVSVTGTVTTTADEGHQVVPAGSRAFFLHGTATGLRNSVSVFATPEGAPTTVTDAAAIGDPQFGAVAGGRLYLANQSPLGGAFRIGVLDAATGATAGTVAIPTSSMPKLIAATPNGATVVAFNDWEAAFADPTISVMAIAAGADAAIRPTLVCAVMVDVVLPARPAVRRAVAPCRLDDPPMLVAAVTVTAPAEGTKTIGVVPVTVVVAVNVSGAFAEDSNAFADN